MQHVLQRKDTKFVMDNADEKQVDMYEFHVDDSDKLWHIANDKYSFGGTTIHFKSQHSKPLIIVGQDECVFQKYLLKTRQWVGPSGERALLPKTYGYGVMVSVFQSR